MIDVGAGECNGHYLGCIVKEGREGEGREEGKVVAKGVLYLADEMEMWVEFCRVNWGKRIEGVVEWGRSFKFYSTILINRSIN